MFIEDNDQDSAANDLLKNNIAFREAETHGKLKTSMMTGLFNKF